MAKILLAEDDADMASMVEDWLNHEQHTVEVVVNGADALDRMRFYSYDLIILDWELPKMSGIDALKEYRGQGGLTPVLMLTGRGQVIHKTEGLDSGADDYLTKPFDGQELSARIRALLRRATKQPSNVLSAGSLSLDTATRAVLKNGKPLNLLPKEFVLLEFFMRHAGEVFSPEALLDRVWKSDSDSSLDAVRMCIKRLREKIDPPDGPSMITTVHRVGYRFDRPA